jgi:hypothetical protein
VPAEVVAELAVKEPSAYGFTWGLLAAAVVTGGTGYYAYKKGWFKKKK